MEKVTEKGFVTYCTPVEHTFSWVSVLSEYKIEYTNRRRCMEYC
jgi:hypothetical protein